jgi:hypothetical protein
LNETSIREHINAGGTLLNNEQVRVDGTANMGDPSTAGLFIKKSTKFDEPDAEYPLFTRTHWDTV